MKRTFSRMKSTQGMTLVEVLVVAAILGVVVMAVMSFFIPSVQNTAIQTEVSDVQSNLRLAIDRMTDDLLTAGFLIGDNLPIIFQGSATPTNANNPDNDDFTIRTALVSGGFGRTASASGDTLVLEDEEMMDLFAVGTYLRLFNPINSSEIETGPFEITSVDSADRELTISPALANPIDSATAEDLVVVRVRDATTPLIQSIRYRLENGALTRTVNGDRQFLARGIDAVNFDYDFAANRRVRRVEITLTGRTEERIVSGTPTQKTRELRTSVTLRNIF
jgi:prepilin-type N-terminal cleavage/methylation domain-containing protein